MRLGCEVRIDDRRESCLRSEKRAEEILVAQNANPWPPSLMGAKYLPSVRDQKATQRFHQNKNPLPLFKKPDAAQSTKKVKTKK